MKAVLLDFNGTLFFDSGFHLEAWAKIYQELCQDIQHPLVQELFCGPRNDVIIQRMAPWLSAKERSIYSRKKEELYRRICLAQPNGIHLVSGAEQFLDRLKEGQVPFLLASASIKENMDFFFRQFRLERWFDQQRCVYDDGTYADKGEMHLEAARRLGIQLKECIVIEDSVSAVAHAKENGAGLIVGVSQDALKDELLFCGADFVIGDFTQFQWKWLSKKREED